MKIWLRRGAVLTILAGLPAASRAQSRPEAPAAPGEQVRYPIVTVGGLLYTQYDYELENKQDFNAFDVSRGYINIGGDLAANIKFRITPDLTRAGDGSLAGSLVYRLKYAYVEFDNLTPRSWLRFGDSQTPWLDFEESIDRYRVQGSMFAEREGIVPGSGDFGIGYLSPLPREYGEVQAGIYNGEGFKLGETNKYKSFQGRVTVRPFPHGGPARGIRISAFYDLGSYDRSQPRRHGIVMGSFEHRHVVATLQWLASTEKPAPAGADLARRGYSGFLEVRRGPEGLAAFARLDQFDADRATRDDSKRRVIGGVAYWLAWQKVRLGLLATDEDVHYDRGLKKPDENRMLAQAHIQF